MTDDDPNESYEVVPIEPGPHGSPEGWWAVKRNDFVAKIVRIWSPETQLRSEKARNWRAFLGFTSVQSKVAGLPGWGGRIRTSAWGNQNPLPYHLATPQLTCPESGGTIAARIP